MECPGLEDGVGGTSQAGFPCLPPYEASRSGRLNAARGQGARKKQKTAVDQWEEAGRVLGSGKCSAVGLAARTRTRGNMGEALSQGDGRQSCTSPLSLLTTSGGECSG
jgi:hypothetical protein